MSRDRAAYMRDYRAKQRQREGDMLGSIARLYGDRELVVPELRATHQRIDELEAEVARLKRELAARPFNSRPFTPVPKPGQRR
jgi:polyhydroxyalkanoate synthesis regulator phasin